VSVVVAASGEPYTVAELLELLRDARSYITPTISTHEEISDVLGWCGCGYCTHVPSSRPIQDGAS
jgi:NTP pyrophosphatase (non-canonical NTP hydrolase)